MSSEKKKPLLKKSAESEVQGFFEEDDKTSILPSDTLKMRIERAVETSPCLVLLTGPSQSMGKQWFFDKNECTIGRTKETTIHIEDESVSRTHAKVMVSKEDLNEVSIVDLDSTNYTLLNGKKIEPFSPKPLKNNDQIQMGNVIFKYLEKGNIEIITAADTFERSMTDSLTGIYNKGALLTKGQELFQKSEFLKKPLSVIVFDIDFFKKINDTHGHSAGDYVLKSLSNFIRDQLIRESDFFARWGGEEFCILTLGSPSSRLKDIAERLRVSIEKYNFQFNNKKIPVTISLGVSVKREGDKSWKDLFERADKALYESKNKGRNQVTLSLF